MNISEKLSTPSIPNSPEKDKSLSPRYISFPEQEKTSEEGSKGKSIARRRSFISTQGAIGIKRAFYHGRVERVKQLQESVAHLKKQSEREALLLAEKDLAREIELLKKSLQDFIANTKELTSVIEEEPQTAVKIIQISDTYFKEWSQDAAKNRFQTFSERTGNWHSLYPNA